MMLFMDKLALGMDSYYEQVHQPPPFTTSLALLRQTPFALNNNTSTTPPNTTYSPGFLSINEPGGYMNPFIFRLFK